MSISTTSTTVTYPGDGVVVALPIPFAFAAAGDLEVVSIDALGNETLLSNLFHYTVKGSTLKMVVAPINGTSVRISRVTPLTQPDSLRNAGTFYPHTVEAMIDRTVMQIQETRDQILEAAPNIATGVYTPGSVGAKPSRLVVTRLRESRIPLTEFAEGDGITNDAQAVKDWLTALSVEKRTGYVPAGEYLLDGIQLIGLSDIHVEAHPGARIIGKRSYQNFAGNGTTGQSFTVTDFALTFGTIRATQITAAGVQVPLAETTHFTVAGLVVTLAGATTIPVGDTIRLVSSEPMFDLRSTGNTTSAVGSFSWEGGYFDCSERGYVLEQGTGGGLSVSNWRKHALHGVNAYAADDYVAGHALGVADTFYTPLQCYSGHVSSNVFQGFGDLGIYATGGALADATDDGRGLLIEGNDFIGCAGAWKAARQIRDVVSTGNTYFKCWIGGAGYPASNIRAGRVTITGETFRRCGRNAIDVRQQVGCTITNNTIIDSGYLPDGVGSATTYIAGSHLNVAINLAGCKGAKVSNNVVRMDELAPLAGSYGIRNTNYTFEGVTDEPGNCTVHDNYIDGVETGIEESSDNNGSNRYRNNDFSRVTTEYAGVTAASLPFGTYTPTLTNTTNIEASAAYVTNWRRDEKDVTVNFVVSIDPTATGVAELRMSLPVPAAANFATDRDLIGVAFNDSANVAARIHAQVGAQNARLRINFTGDIASREWHGSFTYRVA